MEMVLIVKAVDMIVIHENGGLVLVLVEPIDLSENFMESSTNIRVPRLFFTLQKQASEFRDWIVVIYYSLLVVVVYLFELDFCRDLLRKIETEPKRVELKLINFLTQGLRLIRKLERLRDILWGNVRKSAAKVVYWILSVLSLLQNLLLERLIQGLNSLSAFSNLLLLNVVVTLAGVYLFFFIYLIPIFTTSLVNEVIYLGLNVEVYFLFELIISKLWARALRDFEDLDIVHFIPVLIMGVYVGSLLAARFV
jgi:hypothetical protein